MQRALQRRGFAVEIAENADAGLARLRDERFDLAAIDHHMPGKDGLAMLAEIRALPDAPPVVFVTGTDEPQVAVDAMKAGAFDFVIKTVGESFFDLLDSSFRQALERVTLQRANQAAEADLRDANERLEMLVREVHHRVANSLQMVSSFVSMQAGQTADPAAREALAETQNRIQAVSQVHRRLYTRSDVGTIDLDEYLGTLIEDLRNSLPRGRGEVSLTLDAQPVDVSPDQAVSIGVIVNELISNAAKYAFTKGQGGTIDVVLRREADGYCVSVGDDGDGFANGGPVQGTGLGMRIIGAISRSLHSKVERVERARGTCHKLVVPI